MYVCGWVGGCVRTHCNGLFVSTRSLLQVMLETLAADGSSTKMSEMPMKVNQLLFLILKKLFLFLNIIIHIDIVHVTISFSSSSSSSSSSCYSVYLEAHSLYPHVAALTQC